MVKKKRTYSKKGKKNKKTKSKRRAKKVANKRVHKKGVRAHKKSKKKTKAKRAHKKNHLPKMKMHKCSHCGRTIFGGDKGMATHLRKKHKGGKGKKHGAKRVHGKHKAKHKKGGKGKRKKLYGAAAAARKRKYTMRRGRKALHNLGSVDWSFIGSDAANRQKVAEAMRSSMRAGYPAAKPAPAGFNPEYRKKLEARMDAFKAFSGMKKKRAA